MKIQICLQSTSKLHMVIESLMLSIQSLYSAISNPCWYLRQM